MRHVKTDFLFEPISDSAKQLDFPPMGPRLRELMVRVASTYGVVYEVAKSLPGVDKLGMCIFQTHQSRR